MPQSLKKRYVYKLFSNVITFVSSFFIYGIIVPRGLGPGAYGNFNFLTNYFTQFISFLEANTSTGLCTKISRREKEPAMVLFYFYFAGLIFLLVIAFVILMHLTSFYAKIWPQQGIFFIYLAALWGILNWVIQVLAYLTDALGLTVPTELFRIAQKILALFIIIPIFIFKCLTLFTLFLYQYVIFIFLAAALVWLIARKLFIPKVPKLSFAQIKSYIKEFYSYSSPLFVYTLVIFLCNIIDRWLLQMYSGSVQQGFYSFSYQIGITYSFFVSAMTPLFMREFSIAYGKNDATQMRDLFRRHIPLLYSITAFFACFVALQATSIVGLIGGEKYTGAALVVMIMAFYPLHQVYWQLSGSAFLVVEKTKLYRNMGVIVILLGMPLSYFLIAPRGLLGLNMGAVGLAIKMVAIQFIMVNTQLFFNTRIFKFSFWLFFCHQILCVGVFLIFAIIAGVVADKIFINIKQAVLFFLLIKAVLYTVITAAAVICFPVFFGIKKGDMRTIMGYVKNISNR